MAQLDVQYGVVGTLRIDMTSHEGTISHTLMEANGLSDAFGIVSVLKLGARDAMVTVGSTAVTIAVTASGAGQVSIV